MSALPTDQPPLLRVYLLDDFRVYRGEHLIGEPEWKRKKAKTLFKLLLLAPRRSLTREQAIELLWPEAEPVAAAKNLNTVLYTLRRALCPHPTCAEATYVSLEDDRLMVNAEHLTFVDAETFEAQARRALAQTGDRRACEEALARYAGDLLPEDRYEDWTAERRESLRSLYLTLLLRLATVCQRAGDFDETIGALEKVLAAEPSHEEAHRALMRVYALAGRRHDALRQYQRCVEALRRDFEAGPLPETIALHAAILAGEVGPEPGALRLPFLAPTAGPFVGRDREIEALEDALDRVSRGRAEVVLLRGELGIGKTRLAREFLTRATWHDAVVLAGAGREQEGLLPYGPFVEALRGYLLSQSDAVVRRHFGPFAGELVRLLPELQRLAAQPTPPTVLDPALEQTRLFHAVTQALRSLAAERTVVLFVDDTHAADPATLQLLAYLVRNSRDAPLLLLLATRTEDLPPEHPLYDLAAGWRREDVGLDLALASLSVSESVQLVSGLGVETKFSQSVFAVAEGNPLFTLEVARALKEGSARTGEVPPGLRDLLAARLHRMRKPTREVLTLSAAIGAEFTYELTRAASGLDDRRLIDALDEALAAGLIEESGSGYRFRHGLVRQAFYEAPSAHRRIFWHRRIAEALEGLHADRPEALAHYWEAAQVWDRALHYALRAAERARQVYAMEAAIQFYRRAESLLSRLPGRRARLTDRFAIAESLGDALFVAGRYDEAEAEYRTALALAPNPCRAADLYARLGLACERRGQFEGAVAYLEEGQARLGDEPPCVERSRLFNAFGLVYNNHGEHQRGLDFTRKALAVLQALPAAREVQEARATALRQLGMGLGERGEHEAALRAFGECLNIVEALGDEPFIAMTLNCLGSLRVRRGEYARAVAYLERGLALAQRVGDLHVQALCRVNLGDSFQAQGDQASALPHLREAARLAEESGARSLAHYICGVLVPATLAQNDLDAADEYARRAWAAAQALDNPRDLGVAATLLARVAVARGEWEAAEAQFARAFEWLSAGEYRFDRAQAHRHYGEMLLKREEMARGRAELQRALEDFLAVGAVGEAEVVQALLVR